MKQRTLLMIMSLTMALSALAVAPKYVFYFIGDGMGMGPAVATEMYNRQVLNNNTPITMFTFPVVGMATTYSASSPVTDSAAAGTALSAGTKTKNGMLGMNPDTMAVVSIAKVLKDDGFGVGILTSVSPDDATPGAFYAHVPNRSRYYEIGKQAAESGYDFIGGAGLRGLKDKKGNPTDLLEIMAANGVQVIHHGQDVKEMAERVIMLDTEDSDPNNIGYAIDWEEGDLSLAQLTQSCLDHLMKHSPDKFFMMVEGGNIDHALHANDGGTAIIEILDFNKAIDIAVDFYEKHPLETLIVITADHDTGGMTIGNPYTGYNAFLNNVDYQKVSKEAFDHYCRTLLASDQKYSWDQMKQYLTDNFGFWSEIPLKESQEESLKQKFDATFGMRDSEDQKTLYANFNSFAAEVFKVFNDIAGIGFVATSHTGNPVPVFAKGVDAQRFKSLNNNIDIPVTILDIVKQ